MKSVISVILRTYNRSASLKKTLESFAQMQVPADLSWELVLVDNNSSDETRAVAEACAKSWDLPLQYVFESNQGLSYARNTGVKAATGEILVFTDDDVTLGPNWLAEIKRAFDQYDCMGVGGKIVPVWNVPQPSWLVLEGPYRLHAAVLHFNLGDETCIMENKSPYGANMAFRRAAFERYGLFRTDIGLTGTNRMPGQETEFCQRLRTAGEKFVYTPHAVIYHPVEPERVQKKYFQSWYFGFGRTTMRVEGCLQGAVLYFGVPRYLFRLLGEKALRWLVSVHPARRFYHKLQTYQIAGQIYEARQAYKQSRHARRGADTVKG
jgi:glycosyltransferase involved in cell wall biosynthesis